jgi:hypothetical protein
MYRYAEMVDVACCTAYVITMAHSKNVDPDAPEEVDDPCTNEILWSNFHSGANADFQVVEIKDPPHPVLLNPESSTDVICFLPAHPHEER